MERWIAIGRVEDWRDFERFAADLKPTSKWRVGPRTTVVSVVVTDDGLVIAECHAAGRAAVEEWLGATGWQVQSLSRMAHLARTGEAWKVAPA